MRVLMLLLAFAVAPLVQGVAQERRGSDLSWSAESRGHRGSEAQRGDKCKDGDRGDARRASGDADDHRSDGRDARRNDDGRHSRDRDARRGHGDNDDDDGDDDRGRGRKLGHKDCQEAPPAEEPPSPPPAEATGWIAGTVTHDVFGWPGLAGWSVTISGTVSASATTDGSGNFSFTALPAGTYLVCEVVPGGWIQTIPMGGEACPTGVGYSFTLVDGGGAGGVAFSNLSF